MRRILLLVGLAPALALAQPTTSSLPGGGERPVTRIGQSEQTVSTAPGYYRHHLPGEATIQIQVEGAVVNPGLYEIADETDLRRFWRSSRRPARRRPRPQQRPPRRTAADPARHGHGLRRAPGRRRRQPGRDPAAPPRRRALVEVIERRRFGWQDAVTVIGAAGTVAFLYDLLVRR